MPSIRISFAGLLALSFCVLGGQISLMAQNMGSPNREYAAGQYYSYEVPSGGFRISKLLAVEQGGLHVSVYENLFRTRPTEIDPAKLEILAYHFPITRRTFENSKPVYLMHASVMEDELLGYREWEGMAGPDEAKRAATFWDEGRL